MLLSRIIVAVAVLIIAGGQAIAQEKKIIRVNGAAMAADQVDIWAKQFMEQYRDINIIVTGSSAGKGFQALVDKNADIALMSREALAPEIKAAEDKGIKVESKLVGHAGLAVVTSPNNPVDALTIDQLRRIYTGEITNWKEVGGTDAPIRTLTRRIPESGGAVFFWETVLNREPYSPKTIIAESWASIIKVCAVATDIPIGIAPAFIAKGNIKVLPVKKDTQYLAVLPTEETMRNRTYPLILPFSMCWDAAAKNDVLIKFVEYCALKGQGDAEAK